MNAPRSSTSRSEPIDRRNFLVSTAGAAIATVASSVAFGAQERTAVRPRPEVAAIYCPLWHRYDHMDAWHGYGWNEWELLKTAPRAGSIGRCGVKTG